MVVVSEKKLSLPVCQASRPLVRPYNSKEHQLIAQLTNHLAYLDVPWEVLGGGGLCIFVRR
jgi:hypothetical protein